MYVKPAKISKPSGYCVPGTTMTIPNLAPSLLEIIAASSTDGLPLVGKLCFDETDDAGLARTQARQSVISDIHDFGEAQRLEEGPSFTPPAEPISDDNNK